MNRHPKQEPFKRYIYKKNGPTTSGLPYEVEVPSSSDPMIRLRKEQEKLTYIALEATMKTLRAARWRKGDPEIDDYLLDLIHERRLGFGF
jgi:hypothetical protein